MKKTGAYRLNLMESLDVLSAKPLNENAEKIENALAAQESALSGKLMMAAGCYTGTGTRSVTVPTPGFTPRAMLLRRTSGSELQWWIGSDIPGKYNITARSDVPSYGYEPGEQFDDTISTTISFQAATGSLNWSIPEISEKYYDVTSDGGPAVMWNGKNTVYEWIAFGTVG